MTEKEVSEMVEKLKSGCPLLSYCHGTNPYDVAKADRLMTAAASLLERQQAEIENLKHDIGRSIATNTELLAEIERKDEALRKIAEHDVHDHPLPHPSVRNLPKHDRRCVQPEECCVCIARDALSPTEEPKC